MFRLANKRRKWNGERKMSSTDIFLAKFVENFDFLLGKGIVLYGIGVNTALILEHLPQFRILGLLDKNKENIGKEICGKKVISIQEAMKADAIIIVTQDPCYWEVIYRRICDVCVENQIPVYYTDGTQAKRKTIDKDIKENPYWDLKEEFLREAINRAEIVSFDIFDTLIMRKVYSPTTIFSLVELHFTKKYHKTADFANIRRFAETVLVQRGNPTPNYKEIYQYIQETLDLSEEEICYLKQKELNLEEALIMPRDSIVKLYHEAKEMGKEVYLISDMYLGKRQIERMLEICGIEEENLIISVEKKAKKSDGSLWKKYKEIIQEKKALHIGDDRIADVEQAEKVGIYAIEIYSAKKLLENSSLRDMVSDICSREEEVAAGLVISCIFNNPFCLAKSRGIVEWDELEKMGYAMYAAPIYNYLVWLMQQAKRDGNTEILFFARDGYVLQKMYDFMIECYCLENMPRGIYFMISRMLGMLWSIYTKEDIIKILQMRYIGTFGEFMQNRFFISVKDNVHYEESIYTDADFEKVKTYVEPYFEEILQVAKEQRERAINYIKSLNIKNFCISDPSYHGTNQYYLSLLLKKKYKGYYMQANLDEKKNPYGQTAYMYSFYQNEDDKEALKTCLHRNSTQFENGILVAPEGCVIGIDRAGNFIKTPNGFTQDHFFYKEKMISGVRRYIEDISRCYQGIGWEDLPYTANFIDKLFGEMIGYKCIVRQDIKDTFYVDTYFGASFDRKMWE